MHSRYKIKNSSDCFPLDVGTPAVHRLHADKKSEELRFYVQSSISVQKLTTNIVDDESESQTESLKVEPHSFSILATPLTRELLAAEERNRARHLARLEKQEDVEDSDPEPVVQPQRRMFGGIKPNKPNTRDPGKPVRPADQAVTDNKQIFRRSQIERQRVVSGLQTPALPQTPVPVSDLAPSPGKSPVNPLLQSLQSPPTAAATAGKSDLISIQVPMAGADGGQTMQTINIPRSVLAGASDRPILLTVTPKNGVNKGQKQIVVLTRNNKGQTTAACHVPGQSQVGAASTIVSGPGVTSPAKNIQLSPRPGQTVISRPSNVVNNPVRQQQQQPQQKQQQIIKGHIVQTSQGQMLVQGNKQILLSNNMIKDGKLMLNPAQLAQLTGAAGNTPQQQTAGAAGAAGAGDGLPPRQVIRPAAGQSPVVQRSVISAAQLQTMMASGQKFVSVGTNAGGQQVVRVMRQAGAGGGSPVSGARSVIQTPPSNGVVTSSSGSTASLNRILSALNKRGLVSQSQNGKFYYVGDKTKSPTPGVKVATSQGINITSPVTSLPGISSLKPSSAAVSAAASSNSSAGAAVVVAPAANLDSFTADNDLMKMASSFMNSSNGESSLTSPLKQTTAPAQSSSPSTSSSSSVGNSFCYKDRDLPLGWYITINKKQVAEFSYEVETSFYSPEGARLGSLDQVSSYLSGQLSVDNIGHQPPLTLSQMPWREELSDLDKQLVPTIHLTHNSLKRPAAESHILDKRIKSDTVIQT